MASWEETAQGWLNSVVSTGTQVWQANTQVKANTAQQALQNQLEMQKLQMLAYNQYGTPYVEGQVSNGNVKLGIPTAWLLMGGLIIAVMVMKD